MKQLILSFILCSTAAFSQTKVNLDQKTVNDAYIHVYADGTSSIHMQDGKFVNQYTFDGDGKLLGKKKNDYLFPRTYLDKQKLWFSWFIGYKSTDVYVGDFQGNVTKTTVRHKGSNDQIGSSIVTEDGKLEIYLTDNKPSHSKYKKDLIDYVVIQYDPEKKSFNVIDYTDIPDIKGSTSFIGVKKDERLFVNWEESTKGVYKFQVLAVNAQKKVRTFAPTNFTFDKKDGTFVGGSMVYRKGGEWQDYEDVYYAIHTISYANKSALAATFNCDYKVCRVNEKGETAAFSLKVPLQASANSMIVHFPLHCFPENKDNEHTFFIGDRNGSGLTFTSDFSSPKVEMQGVNLPNSLEVYYYKDIFPTLSANLSSSKKAAAFNLCEDGNARFFVETGEKEFTLYQENIPQ